MKGTSESRVLRYFDCRSRGQALRFALRDRGIEFADERIPVEDLKVFRETARRGEGAPFGSLPILEWDGASVAETLVIASYLDAKLGLSPAHSTPEGRAFLEMVASAAHLDMQVPYRELLWLRADVPEERLRVAAEALIAHLTDKLSRLETLLANADSSDPFYGGGEPSMADYFVYESLSRACDVFGREFEQHLTTAPRLAALAAAMAERPRLASFVESGGVPYPVTASPHERALRERLQAAAWRC